MVYFILGVKFGDVYTKFIDAFTVQQDKYPDKIIICTYGKTSEVVWDPKWKNLNCEEL